VVLEQVEVSYNKPDGRPGLWCEDVEQLQVVGWNAAQASGEGALLRLENVREALIRGCRSPRDTRAFVMVGGLTSSQITLMGNDLSSTKTAVETGSDVPAGAVNLNGAGR
jgi:hypothetical protein